MSTSTAGRFVGQSVKRREDPRLLTGHGRYVDDIVLPGHAALHVRAQRRRARAHRARRRRRGARARRRDRGAHRRRPQSRTRARCSRRCCSTMPGAPLRPLADGDVRFVGDPIALIVAESRYVAEDAAELVEVDIDARARGRRRRARARRRRAARAPRARHEPRRGDGVPDRARAARRCSQRRRRRPPHVPPAPPHAACRWRRAASSPRTNPPAGELHAWMSTQNPHEAKHAIARVTGVPSHLVRVDAHDVGGGFGQKFFTPRDELVGRARRAPARPPGQVDRGPAREPHRVEPRPRRRRATARSRSTPTGTSSARTSTTSRTRARSRSARPAARARSSACCSPARTSARWRRCARAAVWTNTCGRGAYRGPWMFETVAREQMIDAAARAIGIDPLELAAPQRRPDRASCPYTLPTGLPLDIVSPAETLEQAAEIIGYDAFRAEQQRAFADEGRLLGIGLGLYVEPSTGMMDPLGTETAVVRVNPSGQVDRVAGHRLARPGHRDDDGAGRRRRARRRLRRRHDRAGRHRGRRRSAAAPAAAGPR